MSSLISFDCEVFMYDWLFVFKDIQTQKFTIILNDRDKLEKFYNEHKNNIYFGYNNKAFDNIIYESILSGANPYTIMTMMFNGAKPTQLRKLYNIMPIDLVSFDLMQDILGMRLKEAEGFMNMPIEETSVPFDIERPLTQEEIEETIFYCKHDVTANEQFLKKHRLSYIQTKMSLIKMFNLSVRDLIFTNAMLCSKILNAKRKSYTDEMIYNKPNTIKLTTAPYLEVEKMYTSGELDYNKTITLDVAGVEHKFAYGGTHGALDNFVYHGEMWNIDVTSYYPSLMIVYDYLSRNVPDKSKFVDIYNRRVEAKKNGNKKVEAPLKLVLNTTYGAMKSEYNELYDPHMANQVCITGQLLLLDLIEKLEPYIKLIQSNTDGILVIPKNKDKVKELLNEWETRSGMKTKIDICTDIWQKDVNNYIMKLDNGKIKLKGSYVAQAEENTLKNSAKIVDIAVVKYFTEQIDPKVTINECKDKYLFQIITKTGGTYKETLWYNKGTLQKTNLVNRVYATKNKSQGKLYKLKIDKGKERKDSIANLPDNCLVDNKDIATIDMIDKSWYIVMAIKRINDFIGGEKHG